ncbi:MAG: NADH-quinone oxidoreductase subunit NuoF [Candidatus Aminicenantes bacterium]|nr:NADH-quinone oxidoreductase subunit NuoF [Candidatus Aminicenantes bacterium]
MRIADESGLKELKNSVLQERDSLRPCITICGGTGCHGYACEKVIAAVENEIERQNLKDKVSMRVTGCHGFCERGPIVVIYPEKVFYQRVAVDDVPEIISQTIINSKIIERLLYTDPNTGVKPVHEDDVPFYNRQKRIIFGNNGKIEPTNISDYIALDGYGALCKALFHMTPDQIIEEVNKSKLRGRGGAGFSTSKKWAITRASKKGMKFIICNCDEGDPGAYMDRSLMEGNPHLVLEGMIIGAYAIGAHEGYIYIRNEYPLAVRNVGIAIKQAEELGLLGKNILNSGFNFTITVHKAAGAFVCGEETALISSIEGKLDGPRPRPPFPAQKGLWGKPTNINNVETLANVPLIIERGADWYSKIGTEKSKGTKIFSLVGKVNNTGLVEVPMGMTLREVVFDIGGGIPKGKNFKAVQTGGPSGGCIPESLIDLPVDFERLTEVGSMMGSGGMIVMDENTCMVDVAKYFLGFLDDESCGKCVPCREGIEKMREILTNICKGEGEEGDIELLEEIALTVKETSLCGLGQTASNPVLTTIKYFRDEYEEHIRNKRCPAGVCLDLISYSIDAEKCNGCGACVRPCPTQAITGEKKKLHSLDQEKCIKCGACFETCKFDSIIIK